MNLLKHDYSYLFRLLVTGVILLAGITLPISGQVTLRYASNETVTWQEAIDMYQWLDDQYEDARLLEIGWTDAGSTWLVQVA